MATRATKCAYCAGAGRDPFGILSELSRCQVCWGKGSVGISEPAVRCAFCGGSGVHRDQRLTCTACGGKGMVSIMEPAESCPRCQRMGAAPELDYLPCVLCKGAGVVQVKVKQAA